MDFFWFVLLRYHLEKRFEVGPAESVKIVEEGPLRATIEISRRLSDASRLTQRVVLTAFSARLDFQTKVLILMI